MAEDKPEDKKNEKKPVDISKLLDDLSSSIDTSNEDLEKVDIKSKLVNQPRQPIVVQNTTRKTNPTEPETKAPSQNSTKSNHEIHDDEEEGFEIPGEIGIIALRNVVVFPGTVMPLAIGRPRSRRLINELATGVVRGNSVMIENPPQHSSDKIVGVIAQRNPETDDPSYDDLYSVGAIVGVLKRLKLPDGNNSVVVHGLTRFRVVEWLGKDPYLRARIEVIQSNFTQTKKMDAQINNIHSMARKMIELSTNIPDEVQVILQNIDDPGALCDFLAANINISIAEKQEILELTDVNRRLDKLSISLASQLELLELSAKIQSKVHKSIDKSQREYYLQEQLKAIQKELGVADQKSAEIDELREQILEAGMPEKVEAEALRELDRLDKIPMMSPEFSVQRNYLEWLCELPWSQSTQDKLNIASARRILNTDHYGLDKVKKRILEFLAVRKLNPDGRSPILCFAGPPGVGKTSLGRSIARSMGRKFVRVSLGGIRDEADIRGHRRTYIGALPGRIIQELRKCESNNPVFMLDELDKIGQDFRGDPASALLEVLDPEQNFSFTDHFIEQPFDLSRVMFIGTANYLGNVPPALRDRLEVIEIPGYTALEKMNIARKYLVPRQMKENGLSEKQIQIKDDALETIIESYTREAGVRNLDREIASVCRAIAAEVAEGKRKSATVTGNQLVKILGPVKYESELALRTSVPGVATGLAYTPVGGDILFIETTLTPGKGQLILTGQLGDVMKESAQAALSVLKSLALQKNKFRDANLRRLSEIAADEKTLVQNDLHVHVPAGAIPKDGPSAGIALFTSIASLLLDIPVNKEVAMTGEITLRGTVLPIGGLKEKILAAKQAGIKTVIIPERNKKDLIDLTKDVTKGLTFVPVSKVDKVIQTALQAEIANPLKSSKKAVERKSGKKNNDT